MKPNAEEHNPDPAYFRSLVGSTGLTQKDLAVLLGCSARALRMWISGNRPYPYTVQFALECLVLSV